MSGYVARKYDNGDDIKMILNQLKIPTLDKPEAFDSMAEDTEKDIYREKIKSYAKDNHVLARTAKKVYSLVLRQCPKSLQAKMKGKEDWKRIYDKSNSVELLNMIKEISFRVNTGTKI